MISLDGPEQSKKVLRLSKLNLELLFRYRSGEAKTNSLGGGSGAFLLLLLLLLSNLLPLLPTYPLGFDEELFIILLFFYAVFESTLPDQDWKLVQKLVKCWLWDKSYIAWGLI